MNERKRTEKYARKRTEKYARITTEKYARITKTRKINDKDCKEKKGKKKNKKEV